MEKENLFHISSETLWRLLFFGIVLTILYLARETISVLLIAIVISLGLEPFVGFLEKKKIPRILGLIIIFFLFLLILAVAIYLITPLLIKEIGGFLTFLNKTLSYFFGFTLSEPSVDFLKKGLVKVFEFIRTGNFSISGTFSKVLNDIVLVVATILITFYLVMEKDGVERFLRAILPNAYERTVLIIFNRFKVKIRRWFLAQLTLSLIVGFLTGLGMWLLGVRYPFVIGLLAALFEIVPIIGPVLVGLISFILTISESFVLSIYVLIFFVLVQQFESHVLTPAIIGKTMKIHPVVVIVSLLGGAQVAGFVGVLLAVPVAVAVQEIIGFLFETKSQRPLLDIDKKNE